MFGKVISFLMGINLFMFGQIQNSESVETQEQALIIGEQAAHRKFPYINYDKYTLKSRYNSNSQEWHVYYCLNGADGLPNPDILGGNGPEVHIRKSDGKIISNLLGV